MRSEEIAVVALVIATALAGTAWWLLPYFPWWAYAVFGLFVAGTLYNQLVQTTAHEKIIDRGDWPNKPKD